MPDYIKQIREMVLAGSGYDSLYITSFARGRTPYEEEQGILTLWRLYGETKGYCLQYSQEKVEHMLDLERQFYSYGILDLIEVQYGINPNDLELHWLAEQMAIKLLIELVRMYEDSRFMEGMPMPRSESEFVHRLLLFCAKHKEEGWVDEREVRIVCFALDKVIPVIFRPTLPKKIQTDPNINKRYIMLGDRRAPAFRPDRINIGPNAELNEREVAGLYPETARDMTPVISKSSISIAA